MRVLMVSWEYPPHIVGGMGKHVLELAPALTAQKVEVHVLTPWLRGGPEHEHTPDGVYVYRVEPPPIDPYDFVNFAQQTNEILARKARDMYGNGDFFDLIHAHDWLSAAAGVTLKHAWQLPLVATMHATERGRCQGHLGNEHSERVNGIEWWLTYEAWRVITCSYFMADQVHDYFGIPLDKVDVVPNGINISPNPFSSEEEKRAFRARFAAADQPIIFYVGRIVYEKGIHILLDAWPQILAEQPQARLIIAGTGPCLDQFKARAWDMGLHSSVDFTGFMSDDDRNRMYFAADIAVFPSLYEPFGIVALEAMAAQCPVVVADTGGLAEVVRPHKTGLTVQPGSAESLAWGILHTLAHPDWARTRAREALGEVRNLFNWSRIAAQTKEVYERVYKEWQEGTWGNRSLQS